MAACARDERREAVREARNGSGKPFLNGIDFLEVSPTDQTVLVVRFLQNLPGAATAPIPPLPAKTLTKDNFSVTGGVRITGIQVNSATLTASNEMTVKVDKAGDFSTYTLHLSVEAPDSNGYDPQLSEIDFSFKINCPSQFDCKPQNECPPGPLDRPNINYLAKDYSSFRQVMLDRMSLLTPNWAERNPADLGIALVELLAYAGDYLSYQQDAIATEAYLGTARRRTSVRRHARLVDYRVNDGSNARVWVQIGVNNDVTTAPGNPPRFPMGTRLLTQLANQPTVLDPSNPILVQAYTGGAVVFETMAPVSNLYALHNRMPLYAWGVGDYCLPKGATTAALSGTYPKLEAGDVLILAEALGPDTGDAADADPTHRIAVRLTAVETGRTDPLTSLPVTYIRWHDDDALPFPVCVSTHTDSEHGSQPVTGVTVALGNIVLADAGRAIGPPVEDSPQESLGVVPSLTWPRFRPLLHQTPLTFAAPYPFAGEGGTPRSAASAFSWTPDQALPAVLSLSGTLDGQTDTWEFASDMLAGTLRPNELVFTVEAESDGSAYIRFGDNEHGARPDFGTSFTASYRVGNGPGGNVAAESIAHIVTTVSGIGGVTNPLAAAGGQAPESIEHVRQSAPFAFRTQERAVTEQDYAAIAERFPGVQRAAATFRWTGSWYTVFITVERTGGLAVDAAFETALRDFMELYRMAGYDLEIESAMYVPLSVELHVCVGQDYFQSDVRSALLEIFNNRILPDGGVGLFYPGNFLLGQPFYLSPLVAAAQRVDGVESVRVITFERIDHPGDDGLKQGYLSADRLELFTLDNDPNFPERGKFRLDLDGGR
jgi:hypothetical protein